MNKQMNKANQKEYIPLPFEAVNRVCCPCSRSRSQTLSWVYLSYAHCTIFSLDMCCLGVHTVCYNFSSIEINKAVLPKMLKEEKICCTQKSWMFFACNETCMICLTCYLFIYLFSWYWYLIIQCMGIIILFVLHATVWAWLFINTSGHILIQST